MLVNEQTLNLTTHTPERASGLLLRGETPNLVLSDIVPPAVTVVLTGQPAAIINTTPAPILTFQRSMELDYCNVAVARGQEAVPSSVSLSTWTPKALVTSPAFFPATAALSLTTYAPEDQGAAGVAAAALTLSGYSPLPQQTLSTSAAEGELALVGQIPGLFFGISQIVDPISRSLILNAGSVVGNVGLSVGTPAAVSMLITYAPTISRTANYTVIPDAGALVLQPTDSGVQRVATGALLFDSFAPNLKEKIIKRETFSLVTLTTRRRAKVLFL